MNRIRGESIWTIECDNNASHGWKQILSLRDKMRNHIVSKIGDGASVFLWHDKSWGPDPITEFIPLEEWNNAYQNIATIPVPEFDEKKQDTYLWYTKDQKVVNYSTNEVWRDWRNEATKVDYLLKKDCKSGTLRNKWLAHSVGHALTPITTYSLSAATKKLCGLPRGQNKGQIEIEGYGRQFKGSLTRWQGQISLIKHSYWLTQARITRESKKAQGDVGFYT
ncbi:hypothetical protein Tco_0804615 [Tanacetum coccineum]|uniref:Uncharacterized protein n=1 Tax=Tanacetum coccineum TaxID=301880 RepID=A0ABQ5A902_9ASTR